MLYLTIIAALAIAVTSAFPRGELTADEGSLYSALRDQALEDKDGRNMDTLGGGNLLRDLEAVLRTHPNLFYGRAARNLDSLSGITFGNHKRDAFGPLYGPDKRNFDEIDRSGFNSFIKKKKNFDEIDRTGFDGFVKRNFDEIDRVGFGSFIKKNDGHH